MQILPDARPGSEALHKNADGAYVPSVVSAVEADGACTALKKSGEKQSVAFTRLLLPADPEKLRDGVQVMWSAKASCESFRPAVIDSPIVGLEDLAVPAARNLLEVGGRAFYRQEEDDSGGIYSATTITAAHDETADLSIEIAQNVRFDRLEPPLLPLNCEAVAVDTKVQYQYREGGTDFYPATVKVVRDDGTFDIVEDDNDAHDSVVISRLFVQGDALDQASLQKGSQVRYGGVRVAVVKEVKEDGECAANYARPPVLSSHTFAGTFDLADEKSSIPLQPSSRSRDRVDHHGMLTHRPNAVDHLPLRSEIRQGFDLWLDRNLRSARGRAVQAQSSTVCARVARIDRAREPRAATERFKGIVEHIDQGQLQLNGIALNHGHSIGPYHQ